jgi:two-component system sensor kinase FixL
MFMSPEISALAAVDQAVIVVNDEGVVVALSELAEKLTGFAAQEAVGEYVESFVPEDLRWGHQRYRRGFLAEPSERDMDPGLKPRVQKPDKTFVPVAVHLEPTRIDGRLYVVAHLSERA